MGGGHDVFDKLDKQESLLFQIADKRGRTLRVQPDIAYILGISALQTLTLLRPLLNQIKIILAALTSNKCCPNQYSQMHHIDPDIYCSSVKGIFVSNQQERKFPPNFLKLFLTANNVSCYS